MAYIYQCDKHPNSGVSIETKTTLLNPFPEDNDLKFDCYLFISCNQCGSLLYSNAQEVLERVKKN